MTQTNVPRKHPMHTVVRPICLPEFSGAGQVNVSQDRVNNFETSRLNKH